MIKVRYGPYTVFVELEFDEYPTVLELADLVAENLQMRRKFRCFRPEMSYERDSFLLSRTTKITGGETLYIWDVPIQ